MIFLRFRMFGKLFTVPKKALYGIVFTLLVIAAAASSCTKKENDVTKKIVLTEMTPAPDKVSENVKTDERVSVYIVGCVKMPGVYNVRADEVLNKVVLMAGGLTEEADRESVNLASGLYDGMMIRIPSVNDEDKTFIVSGTGSGSASQKGKININTAGLEQLMTLPGVGETTAQKIIQYRQEHGKFENIEAIMNVPGIKEGKYSSLKDYITV